MPQPSAVASRPPTTARLKGASGGTRQIAFGARITEEDAAPGHGRRIPGPRGLEERHLQAIWVDRTERELRDQVQWERKWGPINDRKLYAGEGRSSSSAAYTYGSGAEIGRDAAGTERTYLHQHQGNGGGRIKPTRWASYSIINPPVRRPGSGNSGTVDVAATPTPSCRRPGARNNNDNNNRTDRGGLALAYTSANTATAAIVPPSAGRTVVAPGARWQSTRAEKPLVGGSGVASSSATATASSSSSSSSPAPALSNTASSTSPATTTTGTTKSSRVRKSTTSTTRTAIYDPTTALTIVPGKPPPTISTIPCRASMNALSRRRLSGGGAISPLYDESSYDPEALPTTPARGIYIGGSSGTSGTSGGAGKGGQRLHPHTHLRLHHAPPMRTYAFPATSAQEFGWAWGGRTTLEVYGSTSCNYRGVVVANGNAAKV